MQNEETNSYVSPRLRSYGNTALYKSIIVVVVVIIMMLCRARYCHGKLSVFPTVCQSIRPSVPL